MGPRHHRYHSAKAYWRNTNRGCGSGVDHSGDGENAIRLSIIIYTLILLYSLFTSMDGGQAVLLIVVSGVGILCMVIIRLVASYDISIISMRILWIQFAIALILAIIYC